MRPRSSTARTYCFVYSFVLGVLAFGLASPALAQEAVQHPASHTPDIRGGIAGTVRNANATAAVGVTVAATNVESTARFTATTDAQGAYNFAALPVGKYDLTVEAVGLTMYRQGGITATSTPAGNANWRKTLISSATLARVPCIFQLPATRGRRMLYLVDQSGRRYYPRDFQLAREIKHIPQSRHSPALRHNRAPASHRRLRPSLAQAARCRTCAAGRDRGRPSGQ